MLQLADQLDQIAQMKDTASRTTWASAPIKEPSHSQPRGAAFRFDRRTARFQGCGVAEARHERTTLHECVTKYRATHREAEQLWAEDQQHRHRVTTAQ